METYDGHIHTWAGPLLPPEEFLARTASCGIAGGGVFSLCPAGHDPLPGEDQRAGARMDAVLAFTARTPGFLPFFFLDPTERDAVRQVEEAGRAGIRGFKVIVGAYRIADYLDPIRAAAEARLPVMFHSGICGDATPSSANNRPIDFECLFGIPGLKFSLAHLAWPWCDEFVGLYAKLSFARADLTAAGRLATMYADLTPGTPGIYRHEALRRLYLAGYPVARHAFWGCDLGINDYEVQYARWHLERDRAILSEIEEDYRSGKLDRRWLPDLSSIAAPAFGRVWREFVGLDTPAAEAEPGRNP